MALLFPNMVFDIETIPDTNALRVLYPELSKLDDIELVEAVTKQRLDSGKSEFLPHHLQRIVALSCVMRGSQGINILNMGGDTEDESLIIKQFLKIIDKHQPRLISWNGSGFDLPVIQYRALLHGIACPTYWDQGQINKEFKWDNYISRYHQRHLDLMDVLAMYSGRANAPLDDIAKLCGFPGKLGMDGSQVWNAWCNGQRQEIRQYCQTDVANTWLVFLRFSMIRGEISADEYQEEICLLGEWLSEQENATHWEEYLRQWEV